MNEVTFLSTISTRLGRKKPLDQAPTRTVQGAPDFWRHPDTSLLNTSEIFKQQLENLGGQVYLLEDSNQLKPVLSDILKSFTMNHIGVSSDAFIEKYGLEQTLQPYETVVWEKGGVEAFQQVDISLSDCAYAIADTGTIVMMSSPERGRSIALLPTIHIVIVQASQIHYRLGQVLQKLSAISDALPSSVHFISGPSRSSDIENDQTIGIHGPAAVIAIVLNNPA